MKARRELVTQRRSIRVVATREQSQQSQACEERALRDGYRSMTGSLGNVGVEVLDVAAHVEDDEVSLRLAGPVQVGTQSGAASDHLPVLRLRMHRLEEYEVDDIRDVDAGVEHVDGDGDVGLRARGREPVDEVLNVGPRGVRDDRRRLAALLGEVRVEAFLDELGVLLVLREDDRLAEHVAALDVLSLIDEDLEDLVDGVFVEQPAVQDCGIHLVGDVAVLPFEGVPLLAFLVAEVGVADAATHEPEVDDASSRRHEETSRDRVVEFESVGGYSIVELEESIRVVVDVGSGCCGETDDERVEVVEDLAVPVVDRSVCLVDHDEIEVAGAEAAQVVVSRVDEVHHRRVRGDEDTALAVAVGEQVHGCTVGQVRLEGADRLVHERGAVGEEQHPLDPVRALQHVDQRDHGAGLAGSGGHDEQGSAPLVLERVAHSANGAQLVGPLDDSPIDRDGLEGSEHRAPLHGQQQFVFREESCDLAWRVASVIPVPGVVPVRVEDERALAGVAFEGIRVDRGLLTALFRARRGALRFDDGERLSVITPQHVVDLAGARRARDAGHRPLAVAGIIERPARFVEQQVDELFAGLGLGRVGRIRDFVRGAALGVLGLEPRDVCA